MDQKYRVFKTPGDGEIETIPHIECRLCQNCGRMLPLSHQGSCPDCGSELLQEQVIPNASDVFAKTERERRPHWPLYENYPMGGTD